MPLPHHRYVPGLTARHPEGAFDRIREQAHAETRSDAAEHNQAWLFGLDLLEARYAWEAHEVLEMVWMRAGPNTPERAFVQAIIQLANAALKHGMGRPKAALRLCGIAEDHVHQAVLSGQHNVMGLAAVSVLEQIGSVRNCCETGNDVRIVLD